MEFNKSIAYSIVIISLAVFLIDMSSATLLNPTAIWNFDETGFPLVANDSQGLMNLTLNNTVIRMQTGKLNNALRVNNSGVNAALNRTRIPNNLILDANPFTIAFWINASNGGGGTGYVLLGSQGNTATRWSIGTVNGANNVSFSTNSAGVLASPNQTLNGSYNRVVFVREGTGANQFRVYFNNNNVRNTTLSNNLSDNTDNFRIDTANGASTGFNLDDVRIYNNYAWSVSDVSTDWNNGNGQAINSLSVNLNSPADASFQINQSILFNASAIFSSGTVNGLRNATLYLYRGSTLFNQTTINLTGSTNNSLFYVSGFTVSPYTWNVRICANDSSQTYCSFAGSNFTFSHGYLLNTVTYNPSVLGSSNENFVLSVNLSEVVTTSSATLVYNNTRYTSTKATSGNVTTFSNNLNVPVVNLATVKDFYWELVLNNLGTNTSTYQQTVSPILFGLCNATLANNVLNFTTYDSSTGLRLNASLEATFDLFTAGGSGDAQEFNFQDLGENKSNWLFCLNSTTSNVSTNAFISFFANGYDRREYILANATLGSFSAVIPLFLAATADTDVVTVTIKDENYNALVGALVSIQEWDVGTNTFNTIGMFYTDNQGQGIINLELFNVWYRASIVYQGSLVEVTEPQKLADVTWDITVDLPSDNPYEIFNTISYGVTFDNSTNITEFSWVDTSGFVQQGCLRVRQSTSLGYETISLECTTSVAATINYLLNETGEYEITGTIYLVPAYNVSQIVDTLLIRLGTPELQETVSPFGKVITFIFTGTAAYIGVSAANPIWGSLLLVLSIAISWKLGWMNITENIFWGIVILIIIILLRQSKK